MKSNNTKSHHFAHWRTLFTNFRKSYITYAFIVIQLKNLTVRPTLKALFDNAKQQKDKKRASAHYRRITIGKVMTIMSDKARKRVNAR